jgi:hypothetical protein
MAPELQNTEEFPNHMSVEDWGRSLVSRYTSRDPELGPKYRARMPNIHVARIRRYKERKSPRHEYLVAEIAVPESERRYLLLERVAEDIVSTESNKEVFYVSNGSSQSSLALSNNLAALDFVKTLTGWPTDPCIDKLDCENLPQPITVLNLALAAELVHNNSDKYQVMSRQCFWYADTVSAVLETYFPKIKIVYHSQSAIEGRHTESGEVELLDENSGKFMQISLHKRRQDVVNQIVEVFTQRKATIAASVCFFDFYYVL